MLSIVAVLFIGLLIVANSSTPIVTLNSNPPMLNRNSSICEPVTINCTVIQQASIAWFRDGMMTQFGASFSFQIRDANFPMLLYSKDGIVIEVTSAVSDSSTNIFFNATSKLTTTTSVLEMLNVRSIQCGNVGASESISIMLDVQAAPAPSILCSLTPSSGTVSVSIQWPSTQQNVMHYRVSVSPDPTSCSSNQVIPSQVYTCLGLIPEISYNFTVSAVMACGSELQESTQLFFPVTPQVPQIASEVIVESMYNVEAELNQVRVQWSNQPQSAMCRIQLNYTVSLVDNGGGSVERVIDSESCNTTLCNIVFSDFNSSLDYRVVVGAINGIGMSRMTATSVNINGSASTLLQPVFDFKSCMAICNSSETNGTCSIRYSLSPFLDASSELIQAPLNSLVILPSLEPERTYFYVATVTINSSYTFQLPGNFTSEQLIALRLAATNKVLIGLGVIALVIAIILAVMLSVLEKITKRGSWLSLWLLVVGAILLAVCLTLWVAVCVVVTQQDNTCDFKWQSDRDGLIVSCLLFSLVAVVDLVVATIAFFYARKSCNTYSMHEELLKPANTRRNSISTYYLLPRVLVATSEMLPS